MNVLVAGGAGFLGSHLVDAMIAEGHSVWVVDNFSTGSAENLKQHLGNSRLRIVDCDAEDIDAHEDLYNVNFHRVYNLASPASPLAYKADPISTLRAGSAGTDALLLEASKCGARYLQASTSEVYGSPGMHPQPESYWGHVNPIGERSCYDEAKRYGEALVMAYHRVHQLDVRIARIFNTYGPRMDLNDGRMIPAFVKAALERRPMEVHKPGGQTRSLCYVSDMVRGLVEVMECGKAGEVYNLGNPDEQAVWDIAVRLFDIAAHGPEPVLVPQPCVDDPPRRCPDIAKARTELGWEPKVSLYNGLWSTFRWYSERS